MLISSTSAIYSGGGPGFGDYAATKAAIEAYARSWTHEFGPRGITVNTVQLGAIDTDMLILDHAVLAQTVPMRRVGKPEDIGAAVAYLASPGASYVSGATLRIDGGNARLSLSRDARPSGNRPGGRVLHAGSRAAVPKGLSITKRQRPSVPRRTMSVDSPETSEPSRRQSSANIATSPATNAWRTSQCMGSFRSRNTASCSRIAGQPLTVVPGLVTNTASGA